jgi:hypothetical protein
MRRPVAVAVLLLLTACFGDFLVSPTPDVQPSLVIFVALDHNERPTYFVNGDFTPGSDANGRARVMTDSSLRVSDSSLAGVRTPDRQRLFYGWADTSVLVRDTIAVRGPALEEQASLTPTILIPMPSRTDPWLADHVAGDEVRFDVSGSGDVPFGFGSDAGPWRLEVRDARQNRTLLSLHGDSPLVLPIVIPWQWVAAVAGDSLTATLQFSSSFTSLLTPYPTFLHVFGRLTWEMRVVARPSP